MERTRTVCLIVIATIAVGFSLAYLKTVLLPFVVAFFIVIGCRPILSYVENRLKLPRMIAFATTMLAGVFSFCVFALMVWVSIDDLSRHSDAYEERLDHIATWAIKMIPDSEDAEENEDGANDGKVRAADPIPPTQSEEESDEDRAALAEVVPPGISNVTEDPKKALEELLDYGVSYIENQMLSLAAGMSSLLSYSLLILIFVFFLLLGDSDSGGRDSDGDANTDDRPPGILGEIEEQVRKYLVMKTVISLLTGLAFGFVLWLFGVPLAILFGFLAFLLNYIPNFGPLISSVLPVPFLILNATMSPTAAIICFLLCGAIQFISGNVIETRVMGKSFDVNPAFLLLALMFFGLIWGIVGMFLATPIVSIIKIVLQQSYMGKPVAELMAGRWDSFNQQPA